MKRMQLLQPKMTELREKYKDDPTRMNTELMKLYKDYGVNPLSGCLPMLVQIPIFFGFYTMLGTAVELRNSKFLWVQDLSQPDTVFHLAGISGEHPAALSWPGRCSGRWRSRRSPATRCSSACSCSCR